MLVLIALGSAATSAFVIYSLYWGRLNSADMGTMSPSWIAEYNASHTNP